MINTFPRFGQIRPGENTAPVSNPDGSIRVLADRCPTCPFRAGSSFHYQLKAIIGRLKSHPDEGMICHSTYPVDVDKSICRGQFDHYRTSKQGTNKIDFVECPKSEYQVIPYP